MPEQQMTLVQIEQHLDKANIKDNQKKQLC